MPPVEGFMWRTRGGEALCPSEMETSHLFFTLRMIWNNSMPETALFPVARLYHFGPTYTEKYLKDAIYAIGHGLSTRKDIARLWREQMEEMVAILSKHQITQE